VNIVFLHSSGCGGEGMECGGSALRRYGGPHGGGTGASGSSTSRPCCRYGGLPRHHSWLSPSPSQVVSSPVAVQMELWSSIAFLGIRQRTLVQKAGTSV
jgi:hypothetical protein